MKQQSIEELKEMREEYEGYTAAAAIDELIAIREAQGVPVQSLAEYCAEAAEVVKTWPQWKQDGADVTKFTAPQLPVGFVVGYDIHIDENIIAWTQSGANLPVGAELFTAPQLPVVPLTFEEWCARTEQNPVGWVRDAMKDAYDGALSAAPKPENSNA